MAFDVNIRILNQYISNLVRREEAQRQYADYSARKALWFGLAAGVTSIITMAAHAVAPDSLLPIQIGILFGPVNFAIAAILHKYYYRLDCARGRTSDRYELRRQSLEDDFDIEVARIRSAGLTDISAQALLEDALRRYLVAVRTLGDMYASAVLLSPREQIAEEYQLGYDIIHTRADVLHDSGPLAALPDTAICDVAGALESSNSIDDIKGEELRRPSRRLPE